MEEARPEVFSALTTLALHDPEFRERAREDLEGTLSRYGFVLYPSELQLVMEYASRYAGLTDRELILELRPTELRR